MEIKIKDIEERDNCVTVYAEAKYNGEKKTNQFNFSYSQYSDERVERALKHWGKELKTQVDTSTLKNKSIKIGDDE